MTEAKQLVSLCTENHLTISSLESLTVGLFTSTIASIPGASSILKRWFSDLFYTNEKCISSCGCELNSKLWCN